MAVEAENLPQMPPKVLHVIADAADAELAEVREVLADLRGVEVELLGKRLRGDCLHTRDVELVQATQINGQAVRCQF
ncbi:hypothetical protein D3C83_129170 [compost metagenome]